MNTTLKASIVVVFITMLAYGIGCNTQQKSHSTTTKTPESKKFTIKFILGSTRKGRTSEKIGQELKSIADKRTDVRTEVVDLSDYNLPFLNDEVAPAMREAITDPVTQKWSDTIQDADAFIFVVPEYNSGYPGVLKNALDSLYKEWNHKPAAFVGYSGGPSGGTSAIAQLRTVAKAFQMIPVDAEITIPTSWKAFNDRGRLSDNNIEKELNTIIDQLLKAKSTK